MGTFHSMARANLKKVRTFQRLIPQQQSTRGPESASIEMHHFRPHFINFSKTVFYLVNLVFTTFTFRGTFTK